MPCTLAPWEVEFENQQARLRAAKKVLDDHPDLPPHIKHQVKLQSTETVGEKAERLNRELCQAHSMLISIVDNPNPCTRVEEVRQSARYKRHQKLYEAHRFIDRTNKRGS